MNFKRLSLIAILIFVVALLGFDVWVILKSGSSDNSISKVVIEYSYTYPFISFLVGFVCGHLFWQMPKKPKLEPGEK